MWIQSVDFETLFWWIWGSHGSYVLTCVKTKAQKRLHFSQPGADLHRSVKRDLLWGKGVFLYGRCRKGCIFMVDYLCDMGTFSKLIFTHVNIEFFHKWPPPGMNSNNLWAVLNTQHGMQCRVVLLTGNTYLIKRVIDRKSPTSQNNNRLHTQPFWTTLKIALYDVFKKRTNGQTDGQTDRPYQTY